METKSKRYILEVFPYFVEWIVIDRIVQCSLYFDMAKPPLFSRNALCSIKDIFNEPYGMWLSMKRVLENIEDPVVDREFRQHAWKRFLDSEPIKGKWLKKSQRQSNTPTDLSGYTAEYKDKKYIITDMGEMKINGKWVKAVIYTSEESKFQKTYCKTYIEFISKYKINY